MMRVFHHVDKEKKMELIWFSEDRKLLVGFTDGSGISIVIPAEKLKLLGMAIWESGQKKK